MPKKRIKTAKKPKPDLPLTKEKVIANAKSTKHHSPHSLSNAAAEYASSNPKRSISESVNTNDDTGLVIAKRKYYQRSSVSNSSPFELSKNDSLKSFVHNRVQKDEQTPLLPSPISTPTQENLSPSKVSDPVQAIIDQSNGSNSNFPSQDQDINSMDTDKTDQHRRRKRHEWTEDEVQNLREGILRCGVGRWRDILTTFKFHHTRSSIDLKDKWRNLEHYRPYSLHQIRRYILLNENHDYIYTTSGCLHYFNNRWPRDAALKVAARDDLYPDSSSTGPIMIYLRETRGVNESKSNEQESEITVHVYTGSRHRVLCPPILKFEGYRMMWEAKVTKLRTEKLSHGKHALVTSAANMVIPYQPLQEVHCDPEELIPTDSSCYEWVGKSTVLPFDLTSARTCVEADADDDDDDDGQDEAEEDN